MRKNVASQVIGAQMVTASDGSAFTGSVTVAVTGDAGTQATGSVGSGACTHEGNGYHTYAPAQAETNYDLVAFTFTGTGAIPVTVQVYTIGYDPQDTVRLGLTALPNAAADAAGGLIISDAGGLDADAMRNAAVYGGALYYDNVNGAAGSTTGVNGTALSPTTEEASIVTLRTATGLDTIICRPGSAYVLASTVGATTFILEGTASMALASQDVSNVEIVGGYVSGVGSGAGLLLRDTATNGAITIPESSVASGLTLAHTATMEAAGNFDFFDLTSKAGTLAGNSITTGTTRITELAGDLTISGYGSGHTINIYGGTGTVTLATGQSGLTVNVYGGVEVTNNGSATVNDYTRSSQSSVDTVDANVDAIKAKTDSLTFTQAGNVDANVQYINDQVVSGDGGSGTEWSGA